MHTIIKIITIKSTYDNNKNKLFCNINFLVISNYGRVNGIIHQVTQILFEKKNDLPLLHTMFAFYTSINFTHDLLQCWSFFMYVPLNGNLRLWKILTGFSYVMHNIGMNLLLAYFNTNWKNIPEWSLPNSIWHIQ